MLQRLWRTDRPLTATGVLMLAALAAASTGMAIDPRLITGAPAWLKPAKFAASIALYVFTLAWMFTFLPAWPKTRRIAGWTTSLALGLELAIIDLQAWRGTTSHFNVGTVFDGVLWSAMGAAILAQTLASVAVGVALWRQPFTDRALGWALRLGVAVSIAGAFTGGIMAQPTRPQLAAARAGQAMPVAGAHTVGAPDGGRGLAGTGWSLEHGDLRVPHFVGLHALQALPVIALLLVPRRLSEATRVRLVLSAGGSYCALFAILLLQALRGQPVLAPDAVTLATLAVWLTLTAFAAVLSLVTRRAGRTHFAVSG